MKHTVGRILMGAAVVALVGGIWSFSTSPAEAICNSAGPGAFCECSWEQMPVLGPDGSSSTMMCEVERCYSPITELQISLVVVECVVPTFSGGKG